MPLFKASAHIPESFVAALDDHLIESENQLWMLQNEIAEKHSVLIGVFESEDAARLQWAEIQPALAGIDHSALQIEELPDAAWRDAYKAHFKAWQFGPLHWVPVWEKDKFILPAGDQVLWLDPGMAFGTGNHETTRLVVERLVAYAENGKRLTRAVSAPALEERVVIDAGCGSGILALSAAKLGFKKVTGFDNDAEAVRVAEENAGLNELASKVSFFTGDLVSGLAGKKADLLMANIQADVLMTFSSHLVEAVSPGGMLVLSGILSRELESVKTIFHKLRPAWEIDSRIMGEWSDVQLVRPASIR